MTDNKKSELIEITSSAIEIDEDTFNKALRLGGQLTHPNQFQEHPSGNYVHILTYKNINYKMRTPEEIADFKIQFH